MHDYTVTFATLNCINHTKLFIDSLLNSGVDKSKIIAIDNASNDGTQLFLKDLDIGKVILNRENLSCGAAWNQGILESQSEWTIIMNNDIIVGDEFVERLINFAITNKVKIVSPSRIDGPLDYDFKSFALKSQNITSNYSRIGYSNAICFCIHWSVFKKIGFFRANPNLLGFEDGIFYSDIYKNKISHATTGSVWIHHFGEVTQKYLKKTLGVSQKNNLVTVNDRKLYGQSWFERKYHRFILKRNHREWLKTELNAFGFSLHGERTNNKFIWR